MTDEELDDAMDRACTHRDYAVRISCHEDLMSAECKSKPVHSQWCCGRPACKGRVMQIVWAQTRCEPVVVKRKAAA